MTTSPHKNPHNSEAIKSMYLKANVKRTCEPLLGEQMQRRFPTVHARWTIQGSRSSRQGDVPLFKRGDLIISMTLAETFILLVFVICAIISASFVLPHGTPS